MKLRHIPSRIREWWKHRSGTEQLEISFQGVIALATLTYVTVALFQWDAMRESNRINHEALVSIQRAFLFPGHINITRLMDDHGSVASYRIDVAELWKYPGTRSDSAFYTIPAR